MAKIFFQIMLNEVLKRCQNDVSDVNVDVKQQLKTATFYT